MSMALEDYEKKKLDNLRSTLLFAREEDVQKILNAILQDVEGARGHSEREIAMKYYELAIDRLGKLGKAVDGGMLSFSQRHKDNLAKCFKQSDSAWMEKCSALRKLLGNGCLAAIIGPPGTGKTQMATALARAMVENRVMANGYGTAHYTVMADMLADIKATFKPNNPESESGVIKALRRYSLLVIDEMDGRIGAKWAGNVFANLIDGRYRNRLDTLLISNLSWSELEEALGPSIVDRMHEPDTGAIVECDWPSFRRV